MYFLVRFPSRNRHAPSGPVVEVKSRNAHSFSQRKEEFDEKLPPMGDWTLHDLRRTCRKLMTRARVRPDVAELALGHFIKGIQAVYDDPAEFALRASP